MSGTWWLYLLCGTGLLGLVCAVCAAIYSNRPSAEIRDDWWRDQ